jgi:hypothetical protein
MANYLRTFFCTVAVTLLFAAPGFAEIIRLTWNANTEPNIGGYRLSYGTAPGVHPTTVDVGNQTTAQVSGLVPGQRYYFVVRAYATDGSQSGPSNEVTGVALSVVSLTSTANSSPIPTGAPVTWTALASSAPSLEYQFSRQHQPTGTWTVVQPYGASNSFTWTPQVGEEANYVMRVWTRVPGSSEQFDARRETAPFAVGNAGIVIGSVEANTSLPAPVGTPITFKANAIGGPAPLQYRFYRYNYQTNVWTLGRDYSPSDSYTWTPTAGDEGMTFNIQVWVRRDGSTATYDAYRSTDAFAVRNAPPAIASVTANTSFPAGPGTPITWKVAASGGAGPLHYRFYRLSRATGQWTLAQDYGPSDSYTWTPTAADQGTYAIQAWVRRSGATVNYEAVLGTLDFQIGNAVPVIVNLSSDQGPPAAAGAPITWTADASGGPGPLQYAFSLYSVERDSWSVVKPYSSSKTFTWRPGPWDVGSYVLQVDVRRAGSTASEAVASTGTITVANNTVPSIVSVVRGAGLLRVGTPIVWTAKAVGGAPGLEYPFARYNPATQQWTVVQAYSWDTSYAWTPMPGEEGTYSLQVYVRRAGTTGAYEHTVTTGNFTITN